MLEVEVRAVSGDLIFGPESIPASSTVADLKGRISTSELPPNHVAKLLWHDHEMVDDQALLSDCCSGQKGVTSLSIVVALETVAAFLHTWTEPKGELRFEKAGNCAEGKWAWTEEAALEQRSELIASHERVRSDLHWDSDSDSDDEDWFNPSWEWRVEQHEHPVMRVGTGQDDTVTVCLEEEYGYRRWLWYTGMSEVQLAGFWRGIRSMKPYFFDIKKLPGTVVPAWHGYNSTTGLNEIESAGRQGMWSFKPNTLRWVSVEGPGSASGTQIFVPFSGKRWEAHIHQDDDSVLRWPGGEELFHIGHRKLTGFMHETDDSTPNEEPPLWEPGASTRVLAHWEGTWYEGINIERQVWKGEPWFRVESKDDGSKYWFLIADLRPTDSTLLDLLLSCSISSEESA